MKIAITGHGPHKLKSYTTCDYVKNELKTAYKLLKPELIISGMALGVDQWAVEIALDLNIPFLAAIPFIEQDKLWFREQRDHYNWLLYRANEIVYVSDGPYTPAKMHIRNKYMVDNCDLLVAAYNGLKEGGTYSCVKYAESINKKIYYITFKK